MKIYRNGIEVADVKPLDTSYVKEAIMGENSLTLEFYSQSAIDLRRGDSCSVFERTYVASKIPIPEMTQGVYKYTITMLSMREETRKALLMQFGSPEVVYTCTPSEFLSLVVASLQRVQPSAGWTAGDSVVRELLTLSFTNQTCYEALDAVCAKDKWNTEWYVQGHTIHLKEQTQAPVGVSTLAVGAGLRTITPDNSDREYYTRLYALGSTRNSVDGSRLQMTTPYIDVPGATQIIEHVQVFDEIYPRLANATITNVESGSISRWADLNLTFNPEEQQIDGLALHVVFLSGLLVGLDFEANFRVDTFTLIPYTDEGGITWPNAAAYPQVGDKYVLYNLAMPEAYVTAAKAELLAKAQALVAEMSQEPIAVNVTTDDGFFFSTQNRLRLGDVMTIESDTIPVLVGGRSIRLVEFKRYLNTDYRYDSIKFSDTVYKNPLTQVQNDVKETRQVINRAHLDNPTYAARNWRDTQETLNMLNQAVGNFTNGITPVSVQAMTLLLGDDSLQFRFVDNTTSPQEIEHAFTYNPSTKILSTAAGIIQHMTLGIETLSSSRAVSAYRFWNVASFSSFTMDSPDQAWWLYLVCSKSTTSAGFTLSSSHLAFETTDSYNLLVGILNSEYDGDRSFTPLYGYTEITPGRMRLKKVISPDGNTFIDLVTGIIQGTLKFTSGTDVETALGYAQSTASSAASTANEAKNFIDNTLPGELSYLQNQIDGVIDSWFFAYTPSTANQPANTWTTAALKAQHVGDTFTNTQPYVDDTSTPDAGKSWRWVYDEAFDQYIWTPIADSDAVKALLAASEAQDTADSKRRNFTGTTPYPPYEVGDLWSGGPSGDLKRCKTARLTGTYNAADWELASKYTDDTAANAAQADATAALGKIDNIVSDNVLSAAEKPSQRLAWDVVAAEKAVLEAQADSFTITTEKTAYTAAFMALGNYLNDGEGFTVGMIPGWIADAALATDEVIDGSTYRSTWKAYYDARTALLNAISAKAKTLANAAGSVAAAAQQAAEAAQDAADGAQTDATSALNSLTSIISDNVLSAAEKPSMRQAWDVANAERSGIIAQATSFVVNSNAYAQSFITLSEYLNNDTQWSSGVPLWISDANLGTNTTIVGANMRIYWESYYSERQALLNAIAAKAKQVADNAASAAAALDYLKTAMASSTDITGGLLATNVILLKNNAATPAIVGGLSGVATDNVASWFGGTYAQAIADAAKAFKDAMTTGGLDKKDGSGHRAFGNFAWNAIGDIFIKGIIEALGGKIGNYTIEAGNIIGRNTSGAEKMRLSDDIIPPLATLTSGTLYAGEVPSDNRVELCDNTGSGGVATYQFYFDWPLSEFVIPYATQANLSAGQYGVEFSDPSAVNSSSVNAQAFIYNADGSLYWSGNVDTNFSIAAGAYKFKMRLTLNVEVKAYMSTYADYGMDDQSRGIEYTESVARTCFGLDGFFSYWSSALYMYMSQSAGLIYKGAMNIPGVLAAGTINADGSRDANKKWGAKNNISSVTKTAGTYTVPHSVGHENYMVYITPLETGRTYQVAPYKASGSFTVVFKVGSTPTDTPFDYMIIGAN